MAGRNLPPRYPVPPPPKDKKAETQRRFAAGRDSRSNSLNFVPTQVLLRSEDSVDNKAKTGEVKQSLPESNGDFVDFNATDWSPECSENWSPGMDGEKSKEEIYIEQVLYGPTKRKPLPVFEALRCGEFKE